MGEGQELGRGWNRRKRKRGWGGRKGKAGGKGEPREGKERREGEWRG